jgi:putative ABC transport system substrate-binding protein
VVSASGSYERTVEGLRDGLKELGLEEGKQYVFHVRDTHGDLKAAEAAAKSLELEKVDLVFAVPTTSVLSAKRATTAIPIVFVLGSDPVAQGLVASFAQPGGRVTGVFSFRTELNDKRLEILKEIAPRIRNVATFHNPSNPVSTAALKSFRAAAQRLASCWSSGTCDPAMNCGRACAHSSLVKSMRSSRWPTRRCKAMSR